MFANILSLPSLTAVQVERGAVDTTRQLDSILSVLSNPASTAPQSQDARTAARSTLARVYALQTVASSARTLRAPWRAMLTAAATLEGVIDEARDLPPSTVQSAVQFISALALTPRT